MEEILNKFPFKGAIESVVENTIGLINNTYVVTSEYEKYILQRINKDIFKNPEELMENINLTTNYLNDLGKKTLSLIKDKEGALYTTCQGEHWRAFKYIESKSFKKVENIKIVAESAKELANFHKHLISFPIHTLNNTIPDFHNTLVIFKKFQDICLNCPESLTNQSIQEINYILSKEEDCEIIYKLLVKNKLPLRVCHNDPKVSNFLFDHSLNAICLIDLDTLMPGTLLTDISDAIRTICVSETEDESDLKRLHFKCDYFEEFIKTYLDENKMNLNYYELNNIVKSIELIFLEQGIRFLTDYLNGNKYFKVSYRDQNLVRAKNQIYLSKEVVKNNNYLEGIVKQYAR